MKRMNRIILLALALTAGSTATAQNMPEVKALGRVVLHKGDTLYQFYTSQAPRKFRVNPRSLYSWHREDTILVTEGSYAGKLLHGNYKVFYPNNNLREDGSYRYGLKEGDWKTWYPDGRLQSTTAWKNGHLNGAFARYDSSGRRLSEGSHRNGQVHGKLTEYLPDGKKRETYYEEGVKVEGEKAKGAGQGGQ
jgi:hypothetical protein